MAEMQDFLTGLLGGFAKGMITHSTETRRDELLREQQRLSFFNQTAASGNYELLRLLFDDKQLAQYGIKGDKLTALDSMIGLQRKRRQQATEYAETQTETAKLQQRTAQLSLGAAEEEAAIPRGERPSTVRATAEARRATTLADEAETKYQDALRDREAFSKLPEAQQNEIRFKPLYELQIHRDQLAENIAAHKATQAHYEAVAADRTATREERVNAGAAKLAHIDRNKALQESRLVIDKFPKDKKTGKPSAFSNKADAEAAVVRLNQLQSVINSAETKLEDLGELPTDAMQGKWEVGVIPGGGVLGTGALGKDTYMPRLIPQAKPGAEQEAAPAAEGSLADKLNKMQQSLSGKPAQSAAAVSKQPVAAQQQPTQVTIPKDAQGQNALLATIRRAKIARGNEAKIGILTSTGNIPPEAARRMVEDNVLEAFEQSVISTIKTTPKQGQRAR